MFVLRFVALSVCMVEQRGHRSKLYHCPFFDVDAQSRLFQTCTAERPLGCNNYRSEEYSRYLLPSQSVFGADTLDGNATSNASHLVSTWTNCEAWKTLYLQRCRPHCATLGTGVCTPRQPFPRP